MLDKVLDYNKTHNMININDKIVIGVSGGADSIMLLFLLEEIKKSLDIEIYVAHINHGLRGDEASRDEDFVKKLCKKMQIEYKVYHYDIIKIAKDQGLSEEEAGRKVRYKSFYKACKSFKANKIAIAHNKNDNAETILFHLIRGSGIRGLTGISSKREVCIDDNKIEIIRPLLCLSRAEIEEYLSERRIEYKIDSTNLTDNYTRNKIRHKVVDYIAKEINVNAIDNIVKAGEHLQEISKYLDMNMDTAYNSLVSEKDGRYDLLIEELKKYDIVIQKGVVRQILDKMTGSLKNIESKHIDSVLTLLDKRVGKYINLPDSRIVKRGYKDLQFYISAKINKSLNKSSIIINKIPYKYELANNEASLEVKTVKSNGTFPKKACIKWLDYDKIENTIKIRNMQEKDTIQLFKNGGSKKLKDFFIDIKLAKEDREHVLIVADGNNVIWIIDKKASYRMSERYKIDKNTKNILEMKYTDLEDGDER